MSTHLPGFQSFFSFFNHFVLAKLATSSIRVKAQVCCVLTRQVLTEASNPGDDRHEVSHEFLPHHGGVHLARVRLRKKEEKT